MMLISDDARRSFSHFLIISLSSSGRKIYISFLSHRLADTARPLENNSSISKC